MKVCSKCRAEKPLDQFQKHHLGKDGLRADCNTCRAARVRAGRHRRPERTALVLMIQRCHNQKHPKFHHYGGRGIAVADEWRGPGGFDRFFAEIGPKPTPRHEVDRIRNDRGYEPGNVRWATRSEQMKNTRNTRLITFRGQTMCLRDWAKTLGVNDSLIRKRLRLGWSIEAALSTPSQRAA